MQKGYPYNCAFGSDPDKDENGKVLDYVERFCPMCSNWKCEFNENELSAVVRAKDKKIEELFNLSNDLNEELNRISMKQAKEEKKEFVIPETVKCPSCDKTGKPALFEDGHIEVTFECGEYFDFSGKEYFKSFFNLV